MMIGARPLLSLLRDGAAEVCFHGEIVVAHGDRILSATGDGFGAYPARSILKPFQFLATGLAERPLDPWHVPALGSISATPEQTAQLKTWFGGEEFRRRFRWLQLPPSYPLDETARGAVRAEGRAPEVWWNNCFAKHMAILEACDREGWDPAGYPLGEHPYQTRLCTVMGELLGESGFRVATVTDGCRLPTPVLTTERMARLFARLTSAADPAVVRVRRAMLDDPEWIGGPGRLDTRLAQRNPGRVFAKEGADGLLAIGVMPDARHPKGIGILVKSACGYQPNLAAAAVAPLLQELGLLPAHDVPPGQSISYHYRPGVPAPAPIDISPLVDGKTAVFPGDVAFRRTVSMDTCDGSHLTLSSVETTVHIGAHADAPNHFTKTENGGIERVDLRKYAGLCQVVSVDVPRGERVRPSHLDGIAIRARRVLFRTGSFPDPEKFNDDFVALSGELVDWLAARGVVLVGIDTPSIDPAADRELPSHLATARAGMAILEGIVLDDVRPGFYELHALPLKIAGADASPVRAVLRPLP